MNMFNDQMNKLIEEADSYEKCIICLKDGRTVIGRSIAIEYVEDENEEPTDELMIAFVPDGARSGYYITASEIMQVVEYSLQYEFREVQCYKCKHTFMWQRADGESTHAYCWKDTNVYLDLAKCPKCDNEMLIVPHTLEGIPKDTEGIVESGVRGL